MVSTDFKGYATRRESITRFFIRIRVVRCRDHALFPQAMHKVTWLRTR